MSIHLNLREEYFSFFSKDVDNQLWLPLLSLYLVTTGLKNILQLTEACIHLQFRSLKNRVNESYYLDFIHTLDKNSIEVSKGL